MAQKMGYDVECDDVATDFFLKATMLEIWVYWMTEIIPNWTKRIESTKLD
jgi:hypothetical protein